MVELFTLPTPLTGFFKSNNNKKGIKEKTNDFYFVCFTVGYEWGK